MNHDVPRTVATELLPRVRKRPLLSLLHSLRGGRLPVVAAARAVPQVGSGPRSTSSVMPRPVTGWRIWKSPPRNDPRCVRAPGSAVSSWTVPLRVSTIAPTGTEATPAIGTADVAPGRRTRTVPADALTLTRSPSLGVAAGGSGAAEPGASGVPAGGWPDWGAASPAGSDAVVK